jgi:hypothetical protein
LVSVEPARVCIRPPDSWENLHGFTPTPTIQYYNQLICDLGISDTDICIRRSVNPNEFSILNLAAA